MTDRAFTLDHENGTVYGDVSPCSSVSYGLQISLSLLPKAHNGYCVFIREKCLKEDTGTAQLMMMAVRMAHEHLKEHGTAQLDQRIADFDRVSEELRAEYAANKIKEDKKEAKKDAAMKAKGYTHKFVGWIHPRSGDDYMVMAYCSTKPSDRQIAHFLKASQVKDDYKITAL